MSNTPDSKVNTENERPAENDDAGSGGGDGYKKKGGVTSSTRWGQEWLSTEDVGQHPDKLRSPSERQLSGYDDNTTTVGQPGERQNLLTVDHKDDTIPIEGGEEKSVKD